MIGQRQRHAVAQRRVGDSIFRIEQDAAVAAITQLGIQFAKRCDQVGLAMEVERDLAGDGGPEACLPGASYAGI